HDALPIYLRDGRRTRRHRQHHPRCPAHLPDGRHVGRDPPARDPRLRAQRHPVGRRVARDEMAPGFTRGSVMSTQTATHDLLTIEGLGHVYGGAQPFEAIGRLDFTVPEGAFVSIVGPSGCGKTTMLRCLSGLMTPTRGEVRLGGEPVTGVPRDLALVFQDYSRSLFPWRTVAGNIAFVLPRDLPKAQRQVRIQESLDAVGLGDAGSKYPWQLSGGMQQRVAIA